MKEIICRDCGIEMYSIYSSYTKPSKEELIEASEKALATFKPVFGACVMMSATLVAALDIYYSIPAIAVLGDLKIDNNTVFKCNGNIPMPQSDDDFVFGSWDGHCWVMAGDILIDLSLFRTAYRMNTCAISKISVM